MVIGSPCPDLARISGLATPVMPLESPSFVLEGLARTKTVEANNAKAIIDRIGVLLQS